MIKLSFIKYLCCARFHTQNIAYIICLHTHEKSDAILLPLYPPPSHKFTVFLPCWEHPFTKLSSVLAPGLSCLLPRPSPCLANTSSFLFSFQLRRLSPSRRYLPWLKEHNRPQSLMAPIIPFFRCFFSVFITIWKNLICLYIYSLSFPTRMEVTWGWGPQQSCPLIYL